MAEQMMQARPEARQDSADHGGRAASREAGTSSLGRMLNDAPRVAAQRKLAEDIGNGPRTAGLRGTDAMINAAPPPPPRGGLPHQLKSGIEALSGMSMDAVKVHYNSSQPAQLNAHAFAQGRDIHLAPRQERHLPHEAWHVVQQAQGRVRPTATMTAGVPLNDDKGLEAEADRMGARALRAAPRQLSARIGPDRSAGDAEAPRQLSAISLGGGTGVVQRSLGFEYELGAVETYTKGDGGVKAPLAKATVLRNLPLFNATADDPPTGSPDGAMSDLELITPPINDTIPANRAVLERTLTAMTGYLRTLRRHPLETATGGGRFIGAANGLAYDSGVLQATAGLSIGGLANLASDDTAQAAHAEYQARQADKVTLAGRRWVWWRGAKNRALDARADHASKQRDYAVGAADPRLFNSVLAQLGAMPAADARLMAAVMSRIIAIPVAARSGHALPYPKAAAGGLMARSDFATIIGAMPPGIMAHFADAGAFKTPMLNAIRDLLHNDAVVLTDAVFPAPIDGKEQITLTLDTWFDGLYDAGARVDRLTQANYPGDAAADPEREQLESLGSYGNLTDPQAAGATRRPIFEFRNLGAVPANDLVAHGLAIWDLVQRANAGTE